MEGSGMSIQMSDHNLTWGDWSKDTVRLDFDNTSLETVKYWAYRAMTYFHLDGFLILESSRRDKTLRGKCARFTLKRRSHHVIFDRKVKWDLNVKVMASVSLWSHVEGLKDYVIMQAVKGTSTVRLLGKGKGSPKPVFSYGSQKGQIRVYLETRRFILDSLKKMKEPVEKM